MKLLHISALGLTAVTIAAAYGCSSAETERTPIFVAAAGGSKASGGGASIGTGGKANSAGGTASVGSVGKASGTGGASVGSGGANNNASGGKGSGGASNATGGANNATGGANNSACAATPAGVAAMLATHGCNNCHSNDDHWTTADNLVANAVGIEDADHPTCAGGDADNLPLIVNPGNPMMSVLYLKLAGMDAAKCGARMPNGGTPISASELTCVSDWITNTPAP